MQKNAIRSRNIADDLHHFYSGGVPYVRWKLADYAKRHGLNGYVIAKEMMRVSDRGRPSTVYRLLGDDPPARVDLDTLTSLITALRSLLNGTYVVIDDLLEYVDADQERWQPAPPRKPRRGGGRRSRDNASAAVESESEMSDIEF